MAMSDPTDRSVPNAWTARRPQVELDQRPQTVNLSPAPVGAAITCVAGAMFLGVSSQVIPEAPTGGLDDPAALIVWVFPAIGLGALLWGLAQFVIKRRARFEASGVHVWGRGLTGKEDWRTAYADYAGVLHRQHTVRTKNSTRHYQVIQLVHADPDFDLPLLVARGTEPPRAAWEAYAKALDLPALSPDDDRIAARAADSLDASLREQAARGERVDARLPDRPPPEGLTVTSSGAGETEAFEIAFNRRRVPWWIYLGVGLVAAAFLAAGLLDGAAIPSAIGLAMLAGMVWLWRKDARAPRGLRVTRQGVENRDTWPARRKAPTELGVDEIESVRIADKDETGGRQVLIESDRGTMGVGQGLKLDEQAWLRDVLRAALANA